MQWSDRHQRSTRIRAHSVQHCSTSSLDQVRMCFARMVGSSTGSLPRPLKWVLRGYFVVASVARLMPGHPTGRNLRPDLGMVPRHRFPIIMRTASETEGRDLTDKTLRSAQKPEKIDGETSVVGIRIEVRFAQKVRQKPKQ